VALESDRAHAVPIPPTTSVLAAIVPASTARRIFDVIWVTSCRVVPGFAAPPGAVDSIPSTEAEETLWPA